MYCHSLKLSVIPYWIFCSLFFKSIEILFLFGLIKFDTESEYEDGYWINKWFYAREFASPITNVTIEIRYGVGVNGKSTGSAANFNSDSFKDAPG